MGLGSIFVAQLYFLVLRGQVARVVLCRALRALHTVPDGKAQRFELELLEAEASGASRPCAVISV